MSSVNPSQILLETGGTEVRVDCFLPEVNGRRFPAVIGLHGSGGDFQGMAEPAQMLASHGFAVYVLHYFDRTGTVNISDLGTIFRNYPAWMKTVWDAVSSVEKQPTTDPTRIGLIGFSLGAYLSLCSASIDGRIKAVVEFFGGFPKEMKLFMRRLCPVLILHGENDSTVPVQEAYHLQEMLERKNVPYEMKIYPGEGHGFRGETWHDAGRRSLAFLQKYLQHPASL